MNDTNTFIKPLNDSNVIFIIGGSPTVTFNENVTVYSYPKQTIFIDNTYDNKNTEMNVQTTATKKNIFKKLVNKISSFRI
jgi:hypothetical protein